MKPRLITSRSHNRNYQTSYSQLSRGKIPYTEVRSRDENRQRGEVGLN